MEATDVSFRILPTSEGDDSWDIYTFNTDLKNRLKRFAARYPELCQLKNEDKGFCYVSYTVQKSRVSIHLNSPQSEARRKAASEYARRHNNLKHNNLNSSAGQE